MTLTYLMWFESQLSVKSKAKSKDWKWPYKWISLVRCYWKVFINDMYMFMDECAPNNYVDDNSLSCIFPTIDTVMPKICNSWWPCVIMIVIEVSFLTNHENVLGVVIDSKLNFFRHIRSIWNDACRQLNALAVISKCLSARRIIYDSFVASNLNYDPLVWHFYGATNKNKLEKIQERCLTSYEGLIEMANATRPTCYFTTSSHTTWNVHMMPSWNGNIFRVTGPLCGEFTGLGDFPTQRPVTRSFDVFFDLCLNKRLCKQSRGWWFETLSWSLWRLRNAHLYTSVTCQLYKGASAKRKGTAPYGLGYPILSNTVELDVFKSSLKILSTGHLDATVLHVRFWIKFFLIWGIESFNVHNNTPPFASFKISALSMQFKAWHIKLSICKTCIYFGIWYAAYISAVSINSLRPSDAYLRR